MKKRKKLSENKKHTRKIVCGVIIVFCGVIIVGCFVSILDERTMYI